MPMFGYRIVRGPLNSFGIERKISKRFRNINIIGFVLIASIMVISGLAEFQSLSRDVSVDYARLYATSTASALNTHVNREIALLNKAATSRSVIDWFVDEHNTFRKSVAYSELSSVIDLIYNRFLYVVIDGSYNEYLIKQGWRVHDVLPAATIDPNHFDDAWYFETLASEQDYVLNVDIDKLTHSKYVWLNFKVVDSTGRDLGVISAGLDIVNITRDLFSQYDQSAVRSLIIDETGEIQIDSAMLDTSEYLHYVTEAKVDEQSFSPELVAAVYAHLEGIHGFFASTDDPTVIRLSRGQYSYATIAPIEGTNWSVVSMYNSAALFNPMRLLPMLITIFGLFVVFILLTNFMSFRTIFRPLEMLIQSVERTKEDEAAQIYGVGREDEFGDLADTIQTMKDRLDSYAADLEIEVAEQTRFLTLAYEKVDEQNKFILSSIEYARSIQKSLLPRTAAFEAAFYDHSILWRPRDGVGGDIYWFKQFDGGSVLCVCDCTGHGTPGALLTMLVVSAFEASVNEDNFHDTAQIIWELEQRLVHVLNSGTADGDKTSAVDIKNGCDLAVLYIANDKSVTLSSGKTHVFVCDGKESQCIKGQRLAIGEGKLAGKDKIETVHIPASPDNKFYIATDGLFDQIGGEQEIPFGYARFKQIILDSHDETQFQISQRVWAAFEAYRGGQIRRDDVQLITFKP